MYNAGMRCSMLERFWKKVLKTRTCWLWTGTKTAAGYPLFGIPTQGGPHQYIYAHRFNWELSTKKEISPKIELHHACPNKTCIRYSKKHVSDVPRQLNPDSPSFLNSRKTHCVRGHPLSGENLVLVSGPYGPRRQCRKCGALRAKRYLSRCHR